MIAEFKEITGANLADSTRFIKKYKSLETVCLLLLHEGNELMRKAIDAFFNDPQAQSSASAKGDKAKEKKLGEIWEKYKGSSVRALYIGGDADYRSC
jgi:hypothetical protein